MKSVTPCIWHGNCVRNYGAAAAAAAAAVVAVDCCAINLKLKLKIKKLIKIHKQTQRSADTSVKCDEQQKR